MIGTTNHSAHYRRKARVAHGEGEGREISPAQSRCPFDHS